MARHKASKQNNPTQASDVTATIQQANHLLQQGQPQQAITLCRKALKLAPKEPDLLNMLGILYAQHGKPDAAERYLRQATKHSPNEPIYHYNLGKTLAQHNKLDEALDSYHSAITIDPDIAAVHLGIGNILRLKNQHIEAIDSFQQAIRCNSGMAKAHYNLSVTHKEIDQLTAAKKHCLKAIKLKPDYAIAHDHLGTILTVLNNPHEAIQSHQQALRYDPKLAKAHQNLGLIFKTLEQFTTARDHFRQAIQLEPDFATAHTCLGITLSELDEWKEAIAHHQHAINLQPDIAGHYNDLGVTYMKHGDLAQARTSFHHAIDKKPNFTMAHYNLAKLTEHNSGDPAITAMEALLNQDDLGLSNKVHLEFALGKACEDTKNFETAFSHYQRGNGAKSQLLDYNVNDEITHLKSLMTMFDTELCSNQKNYGSSDATPIFIVGMPRSGTTLIEQILSSHPDVHAAGELSTFSQLFSEKFDPKRAPKKPNENTKKSLAIIGEKYIKQLRELHPTAKHITDKMPHNFLYIGAITLALPNAKIIHCQRNPADTCLSSFKNLFTSGHHYSYNLQDLGTYYLSYQEIMVHWHKLLPGKILDIQYEDVVNNLELQARRLTDHCDLPWNDSCLEFHRSTRPVKTASLAQVKKPIYKDAVQRWKQYEKNLQPLLDIINKS